MAVRMLWKVNKDLLIYKSFYFFYLGALGAINPYLPVYLRQIGLSAFAVGLLVGIRPIIQLASAPFWTVVADKFRKRKSILVMSIMAWLVMTIALVFVEPTEEICEFSATNRSHSLFVNYTKLKTGFFKRSNEKTQQVASPERIIRSTQGINGGRGKFSLNKRVSNFVGRIHAPKVKSKEGKLMVFFPNSFQNSSPGSENSLPRIKQVHTSGHKSVLQTNQIPKIDISSPLRLGQHNRNNKITMKIKQRHKDLYKHQPEYLMSKPTKHRINQLHQLTTHKPSSTTESAISTATNNSVTGVVDSINSGSSGQEPIVTHEDNFPETFDPFNMNGKGRTSSSAQLTKFFAKSRNTTTHATKEEEVHYYNMNGVESKPKILNNLESKLTEFSSKLNLKNMSSLSSQNLNTTHPINHRATHKKAVEIDLALSSNNGKSPNKPLKITQKNLFKTNQNEMKRLFVILLVLIVVGEFLETPSAPLSDASLLEYLGEGRIHYGKQRLWGSLGYGISSFLVGTLLERSRHLTCGEEFIDYTTCFCAFTVLMLTTLVITANFEFQYKDVEETSHSVFSTVLTVHYVSFLSAACYMGICNGLLHNFLMWFLEDLGGSKTLMGLAIGSRSSADLITFFVASQLIETLGQIKIVFIALILYGTIFIVYSTMSNPWFALAVEFLGGFTYAASWSACTSYLAEAAPQESVTTMQGKKDSVWE